MKTTLEKLFLRFTGYTYSNLSRLFMRLFVGIMFLQFGVRHLVNFDIMSASFPAVMGMSSQTSLIVMILIETVCSLFIMAGFLTRLATIPPIISMIVAEYYIIHDLMPGIDMAMLTSTMPGYLPLMFIGIYCYILMAGPGKISADYLITIYIMERQGHDLSDSTELQEA
ncbi:MAG: DoxX family protein [Muribaculum sp.]|nr:DoxX family protein [Muribaculum sp.]